MPANEVLAIVAAAKKLPPDAVRPDSTFAELGLDSLDALNIVYELEKKFGVTFTNEDAVGLRNVRQIIERVEQAAACSPAGQ